jgi:PmbA protein
MIPKTINFLRDVLGQVNADACELLFTKDNHALTRFASNAIHQSTAFRSENLHIRLVRNGRVGAITTNSFGQDAIAFAIRRAEELADAQATEPAEPVALPHEEPISQNRAYHETTARVSAYDRADAIRNIIGAANAKGASASGALSHAEEIVCIVNSRGTESFEHLTWAELNLITERDGQTGYAYWRGEDFSAMPALDLAREAIDHCTWPAERTEFEPGPKTVILDSYAVGEILGYLAFVGFGAKAFLEKRTFLTRKLGKKICSSKITLTDDALHPGMVRSFFDSEGMARKRVVMISQGVACSLVTDSATAAKIEQANTGHALPAPNSSGPLPTHVVLEPGKTSLQRMIASTKDGIYVRRLHYVNVVEPMKVVLTGMTKDGTFLIRDGKLTNPVQNLRFTESALRALGKVLQVGRDSRLVEGPLGPVLAPPLKIRDFTFTGATSQ